MAAVLKTAVPGRVPGVRIPPPPPTFAHARVVRELRLAGQFAHDCQRAVERRLAGHPKVAAHRLWKSPRKALQLTGRRVVAGSSVNERAEVLIEPVEGVADETAKCRGKWPPSSTTRCFCAAGVPSSSMNRSRAAALRHGSSKRMGLRRRLFPSVASVGSKRRLTGTSAFRDVTVQQMKDFFRSVDYLASATSALTSERNSLHPRERSGRSKVRSAP
jgi:hypothetical protein